MARPDRPDHGPRRAAPRPRSVVDPPAHALLRVRPDRAEPARRAPHPAADPAPLPAGRCASDRPRRRRDRADRRPARRGGAHPAEHGHRRGLGGAHPRPAGALRRVRRVADGRGDRQQPRLDRPADRAGVPARRRQALLRERHARPRDGEAATGSGGHLLHRVQLPAAAEPGLPAPVPPRGLPAADRRLGPVGQHRGWGRADPPGRGGDGARAHRAADHGLRRTQVRQVHRRRQHLARPADDLAVRLVPVLRQRRGRRRRALPADVHLPVARGDRATGEGRRGAAAPALRAAQAGRPS